MDNDIYILAAILAATLAASRSNLASTPSYLFVYIPLPSFIISSSTRLLTIFRANKKEEKEILRFLPFPQFCYLGMLSFKNASILVYWHITHMAGIWDTSSLLSILSLSNFQIAVSAQTPYPPYVSPGA